MRGSIIIENIGGAAVEVPTLQEPVQEERNPRYLGLSISAAIPNADASFFAYYFCTPGRDCLVPPPGGTTAYPISPSPSGSQMPKIFQKAGIRQLSCSLTFVMPGEPERATQALTAEFRITVQSR